MHTMYAEQNIPEKGNFTQFYFLNYILIETSVFLLILSIYRRLKITTAGGSKY